MPVLPPRFSSLRSPLLIAPFFFWGTAMVAMKGTLAHTSPLFLASFRLLPAGLLILGVGLLLGKPHPQGWRSWSLIGLFALVDGSLFQGFLAEGLQRTDAGLGSVMIDSQPLAVALLASWLFGERIGPWGGLGLAIGIIGISLIGLPDEWILQAWQKLGTHLVLSPPGETTAEAGYLWLPAGQGLSGGQLLEGLFQNGQWLMLLASLSMAVGTIVSRYVSRHADPVMATGWHMVLGGIPLGLMTWQFEPQAIATITLADWGALAYSTVFGSAIAYGLFFYFAASGSLTSLSALTFLTPVFALLFGNLFLQEILSPLQTAGVVLTLISIYFINQRESLSQSLRRSSLPASLPEQPLPLPPAVEEKANHLSG